MVFGTNLACDFLELSAGEQDTEMLTYLMPLAQDFFAISANKRQSAFTSFGLSFSIAIVRLCVWSVIIRIMVLTMLQVLTVVLLSAHRCKLQMARCLLGSHNTMPNKQPLSQPHNLTTLMHNPKHTHGINIQVRCQVRNPLGQ